MEGWIKIYRQLSENPLWTSEPFSKGQAWIDLILLANHKDGFFFKRGVKVNYKRGDVAWSELALSKRWQWSRSKVRKFLNDMEEEQQIKQQKSTVTQLVTIINYDKFQEKEQQKNNRKTAEEQQKDTYKNEKNEENEEKEIISWGEFKKHGFDKLSELGLNPIQYEFSLKAKFEQWQENDWRDGFDNKIVNWKSKLTNQIKYGHIKSMGVDGKKKLSF